MYARSPRSNCPAQPYSNHIQGVLAGSEVQQKTIQRYLKPEIFQRIQKIGIASAYLHDLGKLTRENQLVLEGKGGKMIHHSEAGAAYAQICGNKVVGNIVLGHHSHLHDVNDILHDNESHVPDGRTVEQYFASQLGLLFDLHWKDVEMKMEIEPLSENECSGPEYRLALGILVNADHDNSAFWTGGSVAYDVSIQNCAERLQRTQEAISSFPKTARSLQRSKLTEEALRRNVGPIAVLTAPTGAGKTSIIWQIAHLDDPRKIIYSVAYTAVADQTSEVYGGFLLPDDLPITVDHSAFQVSDTDPELIKRYAKKWAAPIICTTHNALCEILTTSKASESKKYVALPGSHIIIDEYHLIPPHTFGLLLVKLKELVENFGCRVSLLSGTPVRPWLTKGFKKTYGDIVIDSYLSEETEKEAFVTEQERVQTRYLKTRLMESELCQTVLDPNLKGCRLVICSTRQNAAVMASAFIAMGKEVYHISNSLSRKDRAATMKKIIERLKNRNDEFIVVATSCVECGVDFSFCHGFREETNLFSICQARGRVNRHLESKDATFTVFRLKGAQFATHGGETQEVDRMWDMWEEYGDALGSEHCEEYFNELFRLGIKTSVPYKGCHVTDALLLQLEREKMFSELDRLFALITEPNVSFLVTECPEEEWVQNSVEASIGFAERAIKAGEMRLTKAGVYLWVGGYDPVFGIWAEKV